MQFRQKLPPRRLLFFYLWKTGSIHAFPTPLFSTAGSDQNICSYRIVHTAPNICTNFPHVFPPGSFPQRNRKEEQKQKRIQRSKKKEPKRNEEIQEKKKKTRKEKETPIPYLVLVLEVRANDFRTAQQRNRCFVFRMFTDRTYFLLEFCGEAWYTVIHPKPHRQPRPPCRTPPRNAPPFTANLGISSCFFRRIVI